MASASNDPRWNKGGDTDQAMHERLLLGDMDPYKKPEMLRASREPVFVPHSNCSVSS